jgi:predicted permease
MDLSAKDAKDAKKKLFYIGLPSGTFAKLAVNLNLRSNNLLIFSVFCGQKSFSLKGPDNFLKRC